MNVVPTPPPGIRISGGAISSNSPAAPPQPLRAPRAFAAPPKAPPKPQNVVSPDAALHRLMEGNARYVRGETRRHDFRHEREALSKGQNPFAAILSCADSRIAPEFASIPPAATCSFAASPAILPATR